MVRIGVIGCGNWGPNIIRNLFEIEGAQVVKVADLREDRLAAIKTKYPGLSVSTDNDSIFNDEEIDAVVIATPVSSHGRLALTALNRGKSVFIEKPFAASLAEAEEVVEAAEGLGATLMVGHVFEYHPAVIQTKQIVSSGELGDIFHIRSQRLNLGLFQKDINVLWDLACHDISIILYLLESEPRQVTATGACHVDPAIQDVAEMSLFFDHQTVAFVHCSWLDPAKVRRLTIVGSRKMLVFDDQEPVNKIWLFDKGVDATRCGSNPGHYEYDYYSRDVVAPKVNAQEPLKAELAHFLDCVRNGGRSRTDGRSGLRVVKILEAAQKSLDRGGIPVELT